MEARWECWAEHREDITALVRAASAAKRPWAFRSGLRDLLRLSGEPETIVVTCSDGHENVIEVEAGA